MYSSNASLTVWLETARTTASRSKDVVQCPAHLLLLSCSVSVFVQSNFAMPPRVTLQPPRCAGKFFSSIHYLVDHTEQQHYGVQTYSRRHTYKVAPCHLLREIKFLPKLCISPTIILATLAIFILGDCFYAPESNLQCVLASNKCVLYLSATEKSAINVSCIFPCSPESKRGAIYCGLNLCFLCSTKRNGVLNAT